MAGDLKLHVKKKTVVLELPNELQDLQIVVQMIE